MANLCKAARGFVWKGWWGSPAYAMATLKHPSWPALSAWRVSAGAELGLPDLIATIACK